MFNYKDYKVFLACGSVDMRKSINGLSEIVMNNFDIDPREKILFGFCNRQRNRVKILVWDDNGFWIHFKRLEKGKVVWPDIYNDEITMNLSLEDFHNLIKSPGIKQKIKRDEVWRNH